jgi:hypothetical protein
MRATPNLNFTVLEPTARSLKQFVTMLRSIYQNLVDVINGNLGFGDGTKLDNISGSWINVVAPVAPNTDFTVNHNLNRLPVGYWIMQKDRACDIYTGGVVATKTQLTLRATVASAVLRLFIVGLLLGLFSLQSEAQGFAVIGTAWKATTPPGNLGISGAILQPIPSGIISVCPGSTLPAAGVICGSVTSSLFSNAALTTPISNPTNADSVGNYVFFVAAAQSYVVSVSGAGAATYSYVVTSPIVTVGSANANLALSNLASVSINTSLLAQTGVDLGSTTNPFRNLFLYGGGTYGATYFEDTGTPTAARVQTKQDVTDTYVYRATTDSLSNKTFSLTANTLNNSVNTIGHYPRNNGTQYLDSAILSTDLPATTSNCTGQSFAQGLNAGGTPICVVAASSVDVDLTLQGGNIAATTIITPSANGYYRISAYEVLTRVATTSSTLPSVAVTFTDADTSVAEGPEFFIAATNSSNTLGTQGPCNSVGGPCQVYLYAKSGVAIQYQSTNYASAGATSMQYALHIRLEGPF